MTISVEPIGFVESTRSLKTDDYWGGHESFIELCEPYGPQSLAGLDTFSHVEVIYYFHEVDQSRIVTGARHPRNNEAWPEIGIFAQRGKNRPNRLGSTVCRVVRVEGVRLYVSELDAIDGTPVIDLKPVMQEFLPRCEVRQPQWSHEVMDRYWLAGE